MKLEAELRKGLRRTLIREVILGTLAVAGAMTVATLAPNVLTALGKLTSRSGLGSAKSSIARLTKTGLIEFINIRGSKRVRITDKGKRYLHYQLGEVPRPKRWDGHWRMVIFDIRESNRVLRLKLRDLLRRIGFVKLQQSVWVYPYDCEDLITLAKADRKIGLAVLYIVAAKIENDANLRAHFGLQL